MAEAVITEIIREQLCGGGCTQLIMPAQFRDLRFYRSADSPGFSYRQFIHLQFFSSDVSTLPKVLQEVIMTDKF